MFASKLFVFGWLTKFNSDDAIEIDEYSDAVLDAKMKKFSPSREAELTWSAGSE
jgi:hypothetical protein